MLIAKKQIQIWKKNIFRLYPSNEISIYKRNVFSQTMIFKPPYTNENCNLININENQYLEINNLEKFNGSVSEINIKMNNLVDYINNNFDKIKIYFAKEKKSIESIIASVKKSNK